MLTYHPPRHGAIPHSHTTSRALAALTGFLASSGALAILLQDAIRSGAWTLEHGLIPLLMSVQIFTGHLAYAALRQWRLVPGLGFLAVATVATYGVVYTSVGKQKAVAHEAITTSARIEERRQELQALLKDNQDMAEEARRKVASECDGGDGGRCKGKRVTLAVYENAVAGIEAKIAALGPETAPTARADAMAEIVVGLFGGDQEAIRHTLLVLEPVQFALIFECAAMVAFGFAFGPRRQAPARAANDPSPPADRPAHHPSLADTRQTSFPDCPADTPDHPAPRVVAFEGRKVQTLRIIRAELAQGRTIPSQADLCRMTGVARSTLSDWLGEWERSGSIPPRTPDGRCKSLQA